MSTKAISKFTFQVYIEVMLPVGAQILHVYRQDSDICVWVLVDTAEKLRTLRRFRALGAGLIHTDENLSYIGTIHFSGGYPTLHVFEVIPEQGIST